MPGVAQILASDLMRAHFSALGVDGGAINVGKEALKMLNHHTSPKFCKVQKRIMHQAGEQCRLDFLAMIC